VLKLNCCQGYLEDCGINKFMVVSINAFWQFDNPLSWFRSATLICHKDS